MNDELPKIVRRIRSYASEEDAQVVLERFIAKLIERENLKKMAMIEELSRDLDEVVISIAKRMETAAKRADDRLESTLAEMIMIKQNL